MMSKGSKEALTVLIVTYVTHVKGVKIVFVAFTQHCIQNNVTSLTHVERVKSVLCIKWPLAPPKYAVRAHNIFTHNFLNIQLIFNPKKVLESWDLDLSNHTI